MGAFRRLVAGPDRRTTNADHETIHQTIRRATAMLEILWSRPEPSRLADVARAMALDRSTTLRLLSSLEELGYVHRDPATKTYRIGYMAQRLGARPQLLAVNTALARRYAETLAGQTGETVVIAALEGVSTVYHLCIPGPQYDRAVTVRTGVAYHAHASAAGKMLLGNLSAEAIAELYAETHLARIASRTIIDRDTLAQRAIEARRAGFAIEENEGEEGRAGVAVPVVNSRGFANMSIGILTRVEASAWQRRDDLTAACRHAAEAIYRHVLC
jgi:IclR family transcriptional regulator, pca regulon regulatory protein